MIFLLGIQAMLGQEPPIYFRSITTTRIPFLARVQARYLPASPQPSTTTSYSSGCDMGVCIDTNGSFHAFGPIWECDPDVWWQDVEINLRGTFHLMSVHGEFSYST